MTERLIIVKTPILLDNYGMPADEDLVFKVDQVVGITAPQAPTFVEYGYRPDGTETEEELVLEDDVAGRVDDFYRQCLAVPEELRPEYDCHSFAAYAVGKITKIQLHKRYRYQDILPAQSDSLECGEPYGVTTPDSSIPHSVLGINRPDFNLSVVGCNSPLVVSSNTDIIELYGGDSMQQLVV